MPDTGRPNLGCFFPLAPRVVVSYSLCLLECRFRTPSSAGRCIFWVDCSRGPSLAGPPSTTWLRVATSPQVGVSCIPLEGGGHRLAFPHSKAGPCQSGPPLAAGGPLAVVGEIVSRPLSSHPFQKALVSAHSGPGVQAVESDSSSPSPACSAACCLWPAS